MKHYTHISSLSILVGILGFMSTGCGGRGDVFLLTPQPNLTPFSCDQLDQSACDQDDRCQAAYLPGAPCATGEDCPAIQFDVCIETPDSPPLCDQFLCSMSCAFGYATDTSGCPFCACLPPNIACEEMNEEQCREADNCYGVYHSAGRPVGPGEGALPCDPEQDPNCGGTRPAPPSQNPEFQECLPNQVAECESNADCPGGYCEKVQDQPTGGLNAPTLAQCVFPACNDGSILQCRSPRPLCESGSIPSIRDGCWTCVNENSCEPNNCQIGPGVKRTYVSRDANLCAQWGEFMCRDGGKYFSNDCGCGCETEDIPEPRCPPPSDTWRYVSQDPQVCERIDYDCSEGFTAFLNSCGCGCKRNQMSSPLPPPQRIWDCGEGTSAWCDVEPPQCEDGTILTVRNQCWACIAPEAC